MCIISLNVRNSTLAAAQLTRQRRRGLAATIRKGSHAQICARVCSTAQLSTDLLSRRSLGGLGAKKSAVATSLHTRRNGPARLGYFFRSAVIEGSPSAIRPPASRRSVLSTPVPKQQDAARQGRLGFGELVNIQCHNLQSQVCQTRGRARECSLHKQRISHAERVGCERFTWIGFDDVPVANDMPSDPGRVDEECVVTHA